MCNGEQAARSRYLVDVERTEELFVICGTLLEQGRKVERGTTLHRNLGKGEVDARRWDHGTADGEDLRCRPWTISLIATQPQRTGGTAQGKRREREKGRVK